ncbi:MAG: type II toxin-antitoxin system RelE/ParE family toxin [Candidatus Poribacteria bacterium]|nr:type II toxin-antitoxin system RelE/ParE family toxin [Candidatus Poribacteria bacterium]
MPSYKVRIDSSARRQLRDLPPDLRDRISSRIDQLAENPRPPGVTKLQGSRNRYLIRVGDYRVIYDIEDGDLLVIVIVVAHRRESYR